LNSAIKATFALLQQQGKAVEEKKIAFESDYNRITRRYSEIFENLDSECYKRIRSLESPSFNLSEKVQNELLCKNSSDTAAKNILGIEEIASSKTELLVSSLKKKSLDVLQTLIDYITQEHRVKVMIDSSLVNEEISENTAIYIPVLWTESDMLDGSTIQHESFLPDYIEQRKKQEISEKVEGFCSGNSETVWKDMTEEERKALNREFNLISESSFSNAEDKIEQRIYNTMLSLWQVSNINTLERRA
jgi:hypothetical protein